MLKEEDGAVTDKPVTVADDPIVTEVVPDFPEKLAVIVTEPAATPLTKPEETVAFPLEAVQLAWLVTSLLEPSL